MELDKRIKKDLKAHLEKTVEMIRKHDGWDLINIPELSERELLSIARHHGLENDDQTKDFCKFISIGTNFASMDFRERIQTIPALVNSLRDLILKMEEEIKEYADIAISFQNIIQTFVKLVMNTKHNMRMALPHLEESIVHMAILCDALAPNSTNKLNSEDLLDVDLALSNMSNGITNLLEHAKSSKEESLLIDQKITHLKENIENKITIVQNRIGFGKLLPKVGATIGMISGAGSVGTAVESIAFGGAGALVLGGFSFPPLGAILLGAAVGALGIGSLLLLIVKLWEKHQFKALAYLKEILDKLNKLNNANLAFMDYMNKSQEDANKILTNIEFFKRNVKNGSQRYRKMNADICYKAAESTRDMIRTIKQINEIDLKQWVEVKEMPNYSILDDEVNKALDTI